MADDDDVVLFKIGIHLSCIPPGVKEGEERIYKRCELLLYKVTQGVAQSKTEPVKLTQQFCLIIAITIETT